MVSKRDTRKRFFGRAARFALAAALCVFAPMARAQDAAKPAAQESFGTVAGTVVDQTGAFVPGARVELTAVKPSVDEKAFTDTNGQFYFLNVPAADFRLTISAEHFENATVTGTVHAGEHYVAPQIVLTLATQTTSVSVTQTQEEIAEEQLKVQETQRVLGFIPNFYVTYVPDAAPLTAKQKFRLAWKSSSDPVTIALVAALAGGEQASNEYKGYGQGAQGYGKRFGATLADVVDGTFLGAAVFPTVLKQDPRYFYKGTGSTQSRLFYAIANAFICKGDNKKWQPNYSNILGNLAAGGIANAYYPAGDRGAGLTFATAGIRIGETAAAGIFQEFVVRKLTPRAAKSDPKP
ncbi:MAG TPA: carboxypeptidase-like regulatory domain-containing protein [Verrucomicrobiae bacterium]|nr:carboxypeptidase-like regulatory domain-containing protein [Verrucomicrobiae bacterium]